MHKIRNLIYAILMFFIVLSCSSIKPVKPVLEIPAAPIPEISASQLEIPITIHLNTFLKELDSSLFKSMNHMDNWECEGNNCIKYKIDRGDLDGSIHENMLSVHTQISYEVLLGRKLFGKIQPLFSSGLHRIPVGITTHLNFQNDWQLISNTSIMPISDEDNDHTGIENNVTSRIISQIRQRLNEGFTYMDRETGKLFNIASRVEDLWNKIQVPMKVHEDTWFAINAEAISASPWQGDGQTGQVTLGILCYPQIYYRSTPPVITKMPLPQFVTLTDSLQAFHINLYGEVSYREVSTLINNELKNKDIPIGSRHIIIKDVQIQAIGQKLMIQVEIAGTVKGIVYFLGTPVFDTENQTITIKDFDFSVETKAVLIKMANWLLHDEFKKLVEGKLKIPVGNQIRKAQDDLTSAMNCPIDPHVQLSGSITSLSPLGVFITDQSLKTVVIADGMIRVTIH